MWIIVARGNGKELRQVMEYGPGRGVNERRLRKPGGEQSICGVRRTLDVVWGQH